MNQRKPPSKCRHTERPTRRDFPRAEQDDRHDGPTTHLGAQIEDAGYGSGHGTFGFTHHTTP